MCSPHDSMKALIRKYERDLTSHEAPKRNYAQIRLSEIRAAQDNLEQHNRFMAFEREFLEEELN